MSRADEPAYPVVGPEDAVDTGMTIRERFAMAAMQGILRRSDSALTGYYEGVATHAVRHADALIAALAEPRREE